MTWFWCCCCPYGGPPDCEAPTDGTVTWFTHTVNEDGTITRVNHSGSCFTVYVNSTSGDVAETGNGTESRPFVNLNSIFVSSMTKSGTGTLSSGIFTPGSAPAGWTAGRLIGTKLTLDGVDYDVTANTTTTATIDSPPADDTYTWALKVFDDDCIYNICITDGCPKVKVLVKGTVDYIITSNLGRNYGRQLVIEPWGVGPIEIIASEAGLGLRRAVSCTGCIWKNTNATHSAIRSSGFGDCGSSTFDNCTGSGNGGAGYGFVTCVSSTFDNCTGSGTSGGFSIAEGTGFWGCNSSTFKACNGTGTASGGNTGHGIGFASCDLSVFDTCTATGTGAATGAGLGRATGLGFWDCVSSTFNNCTGTGVGDGFGISTGTGFDSCVSSAFDTCNGNGDAVGSACNRACGFRDNTDASFLNCTTSARICTDCTVPQCDAWVCDI